VLEAVGLSKENVRLSDRDETVSTRKHREPPITTEGKLEALAGVRV
jgi:hypothetical protein